MDALYVPSSSGVVATEYTRGPWDPNAQHGGAPAALLMRAFELTEPDPGLQLTRVTYELIKPVPLGDLLISCEVVRPGRRVQLLEGTISTTDGTPVVRARALRVRRAEVDSGGPLSTDLLAAEAAAGSVAAPSGWEGIAESGFGFDHVVFPGNGMEVRFVNGSFFELGPSTVWFRLKVPVVPSETPSPLQRMAAASDFPNGIATELDWAKYVFINPDLTLYIEREPVGEWIALQGAMRVVAGGAGISQAVIYDEQGRIGRSLQSLYVAER
jgi:hypothetical protein